MVERDDSQFVVQGQQVTVRMDAVAGNRAVFLGYFLPFLILIAALVIFSFFMTEAWAGLMAMVCLIPYYTGLYLLRDWLKSRFRFNIEQN